MREKTIKGIAAVTKGEKLVMGVIFMALTAVIFVQILTRWLGLKSFSWLEEVLSLRCVRRYEHLHQ